MTMLAGAPWLLAHKSMLPINEPRLFSVLGRDYVLWKGASGLISALPNQCPHMGAMLSAGWCQSRRHTSTITCPFHALEFDGQGCTVLPGTDKQTLPQLQPLELVTQGDLIWTYGDQPVKLDIPPVLSEIAKTYEFIGSVGDASVNTDLLNMLLIMHDYNHQNGTHRSLFEIERVELERFEDKGFRSDAWVTNITAPKGFFHKIAKPSLFLLPKVIQSHLENHFPNIVIFRSESPLGEIAQCHLFVPESPTKTRTYVLMYGKAKSSAFHLIKKQFLNFAGVVVEQDSDMLEKIYADSPKKIRMNNEAGMDWVRRNFESFAGVTH